MIIRDDQMKAFQAAGDPDFIDRAKRYLRQEYPELTDELTNPVLEAMVVNGMARARGHGLNWESSLIRFLELMFTVAPNFDEQPGIRARLRDASLPEKELVDRLLEETSFTEWQQAARDYDPSAWGVDVNEHPALLELRGQFPE